MSNIKQDWADLVKRVAPEEARAPEPTYKFSNGKRFVKKKKKSAGI